MQRYYMMRDLWVSYDIISYQKKVFFFILRTHKKKKKKKEKERRSLVRYKNEVLTAQQIPSIINL